MGHLSKADTNTYKYIVPSTAGNRNRIIAVLGGCARLDENEDCLRMSARRCQPGIVGRFADRLICTVHRLSDQKTHTNR